MVSGDLAPGLRADLERVLLRLAQAGHVPDRGEREIRVRLDRDHRLRWFEGSTIRVPASELEAGFDETGG